MVGIIEAQKKEKDAILFFVNEKTGSCHDAMSGSILEHLQLMWPSKPAEQQQPSEVVFSTLIPAVVFIALHSYSLISVISLVSTSLCFPYVLPLCVPLAQ